jgi:hypothetical protein
VALALPIVAAPTVVAVIVPLLVIAAAVMLPFAVIVVNDPVLACPFTLPIGVFCNPPDAVILPVVEITDTFVIV